MFRGDARSLAFLLHLDLLFLYGVRGHGFDLALPDVLYVADTGLNDLKEVLEYVDDVGLLLLNFLHDTTSCHFLPVSYKQQF